MGLNFINEIKQLRREYAELELKVKDLRDRIGRGEEGRYVSLAYTELESSRHWLGEALGALGELFEK